MAQSIAQAQAALLAGGNYSTGMQRADIGDELAATDSAIIRAAARFVEDAQANLRKTDRISTGFLQDSIVPKVKEWGNGVNIIQIMVADYYKFVDRGVKGLKGGNSLSNYQFKYANPSKKMVNALEKWVKKEGIKFRNTKVAVTTREQKRAKISSVSRSTAYMIGKSIKKKGLKPTRFWTDALAELEKDIATGVASALRIDVIETFK
jgi:hypothetical protein